MRLIFGIFEDILTGCVSRGEIYLQHQSSYCLHKGDAYVIRKISKTKKVEFEILQTPMYGQSQYFRVTLLPLK